MRWLSWSEFFSMGGYASYVWGSYGVTLVLLGGEVLLLLKQKRSDARQDARQEQIETGKSKFETAL